LFYLEQPSWKGVFYLERVRGGRFDKFRYLFEPNLFGEGL